jgi:hypothetical protein
VNSFRAIVLKTGIVAGVLFVIHEYLPANSVAVIWPLIAGAAAFWYATRLPAEHRLWHGLAAAVTAGVIAGATAFVAISVVASVRMHLFHAQLQQSGVQSTWVTAAMLFAFAMIGVVDIAFAVIGGVLMLPVRFFQLRRAHT